MIRIDQERLEIKEFVLDSNLNLISNALTMVSAFGGFLYYLIGLFYYTGKIELFIFIAATVMFTTLILFRVLGFKSIAKQKQYIKNLNSLYEETI